MKVCVFVLVPPDAPNFFYAVDSLMAPFRWDIEVEPFPTECPCIQSRAQREVIDRVVARIGKIPEVKARLAHLGLTDEQRARYNELLEKRGEYDGSMAGRLNATEAAELVELNEIDYRPTLEASRLWHEQERQEWTENPPVLRPAADCAECGGSGVMTTTDNPNGKYESYTISWELEVPAYDPEQDEAIRLDCTKPPELSCALEEQPEEVTLAAVLSLPARLFRAVRAALRIGSPNSCQGCVGYAVRLRWAQDWKENRESMLPVSWLDESPVFPYAIVTPDGKWHDLDVSELDEATTEQAWSESVAKFNQLTEEHASCYVAACRIRI